MTAALIGIGIAIVAIPLYIGLVMVLSLGIHRTYQLILRKANEHDEIHHLSFPRHR